MNVNFSPELAHRVNTRTRGHVWCGKPDVHGPLSSPKKCFVRTRGDREKGIVTFS